MTNPNCRVLIFSILRFISTKCCKTQNFMSNFCFKFNRFMTEISSTYSRSQM